MGGLGYATNETLTIGDSSLGSGGAPDFTFDVLTIGTWGEKYRNRKRPKRQVELVHMTLSQADGTMMKKVHYLVVKTMLLMTKLRIDGQVFYSSANVTFDVASTTKKQRISKQIFWKQTRMYVSM